MNEDQFSKLREEEWRAIAAGVANNAAAEGQAELASVLQAWIIASLIGHKKALEHAVLERLDHVTREIYVQMKEVTQ